MALVCGSLTVASRECGLRPLTLTLFFFAEPGLWPVSLYTIIMSSSQDFIRLNRSNSEGPSGSAEDHKIKAMHHESNGHHGATLPSGTPKSIFGPYPSEEAGSSHALTESRSIVYAESQAHIPQLRTTAEILSNPRRTIMPLPNEILRDILSYATHDTLSNVCATSRSLCALAQPILYSTLIQPQGKISSFWPYLRTLVARPDLAAQAHSLSICNRGLMSQASYQWGGDNDSEEEDFKRASWEDNKAKRLGRPLWKEWKFCQDEKVYDIFYQRWSSFVYADRVTNTREDWDSHHNIIGEYLFILLSPVPNLNSLTLKLRLPSLEFTPIAQHAKLQGSDQMLGKLTSLKVVFGDPNKKSGYSLTDLTLLLDSPSLTSVTISKCRSTIGFDYIEKGLNMQSFSF